MQAIHRLAATGAASVPLLHCSRLAASPAAAACHRCIGSAAIQASPAVCARDWPRTAPGRRHLPPAAAAYTVVTGSTGGGDGSSSGGSSSQQPAAALRLIVYSREGCHLCEGLKEKLEALLERAAFLPSPLRWGGQGGVGGAGRGAACLTSAAMPALVHPSAVSLLPLEVSRRLPTAACPHCPTAPLSPPPSTEHSECLSGRPPACLPSCLTCSGAELEVRDITTNPDWEQRYALTIPVLAVVAGAVQGGGGGAGEVGGRASGVLAQ